MAETMMIKKASRLVRLFCGGFVYTLFALTCRAETQLYTWKEPHMGTEFTIRVWAEEGQVGDLTLLTRKAFARIAELNRTLSDYLPESALNEFAKAPAGQAIPACEDIFTLFVKSGELT
jgi:hypothetical protein